MEILECKEATEILSSNTKVVTTDHQSSMDINKIEVEANADDKITAPLPNKLKV